MKQRDGKNRQIDKLVNKRRKDLQRETTEKTKGSSSWAESHGENTIWRCQIEKKPVEIILKNQSLEEMGCPEKNRIS